MTVPVEAKRQSAAIDHLGALRRGLAWRRVLNRDMDMGAKAQSCSGKVLARSRTRGATGGLAGGNAGCSCPCCVQWS